MPVWKREAAVQCILNDFQEWNGCTLLEVRYAPDSDPEYRLRQYRCAANKPDAVDCICFQITCMTQTADRDGGDIEPQTLCTEIDYILILTDEHEWVFFTCAY